MPVSIEVLYLLKIKSRKDMCETVTFTKKDR